MKKQRRRRSRVSDFAAGLIALLIVIPLIYLGFTKALPFQHHYEIRAAFSNAVDIRTGSPVRIAGVNVGVVKGLEHVPGGHGGTYVKMTIEDQGRPVHTDATAKIRPRIFLEGNFFVDLNPGSPSAPEIADGGTVPITQTATAVQLDQVLTGLQGGTRHNLQLLLQEYGTAVRRGAAGFNRSIKYWRQAYTTGAQVNQATLGQAPHDLSGYIDRGGASAQALDAHPQQLKDLVHYFRITAGAFAAQRTALSATVNELPNTLEVGRPALAALDRAFPPVRRLVAALRPGVRSTGPMIDASLPFIHQLRDLVQPAELRGLVADLRPTVPDLARLQSDTIPLLRQVRLASSCQNDVILPWTHDHITDDKFAGLTQEPVYQEATKFLPGISSESTSGDANGQWFRVLLGSGPLQLPNVPGKIGMAINPLKGLQPPKPTTRPPIRPQVPCETQLTPDLRANVGNMDSTAVSQSLNADGRARLKRASAAAIRSARTMIKAAHLPLAVSSTPATAADVRRAAAYARRMRGR